MSAPQEQPAPPAPSQQQPTPPQPQVKFCGLCNPADVPAMNACAPDFVGFVFWSRSKRNVTPDEAAALRAALDPAIRTVSVTVNADLHLLAALHEAGTIQVAQLHGGEPPQYVADLRKLVPGLEVWQAFEVRSAADVQAANASTADLVLLDAGKGGGATFDWRLLGGVNRPYALAGGLSPSNVGAALRSAAPSPLLVDVSSGIEAAASAEGGAGNEGKPRKDLRLMQEFLEIVRTNNDK